MTRTTADVVEISDTVQMPSTPTTFRDRAEPPFGLLLDVDGPIASPVSRTLAVGSIGPDLAAMANRGIPVIFNTGRSDAFIAEQVVPVLRDAGLEQDAPVFTISEKGAVWAEVTPQGLGEVHVDAELTLPSVLFDEVRDLVAEKFSDFMFFDETKRAMVSVEQVVDVANEDYLAVQPDFGAEFSTLVERLGLDHVRLEPTIISSDIEHDGLGKALGARRALTWLAGRGVAPRSWFTMGDSRSDYTMATWLHEQGHPVTHVDVRPADGVPETAYPVLTSDTGAIHDHAGAEFLSQWAQSLD